MKKEEIYNYRIEKGWINFPKVKEAILQAMEDYAKQARQDTFEKMKIDVVGKLSIAQTMQFSIQSVIDKIINLKLEKE